MNFKDFNINHHDAIYLIILLIFTSCITFKLISFQMSGGMYSPDECLYLISAYKYAGLDYYNICDVNDLFFTPVISILTSLLLRCGFEGHFAISFTTAIFGILSIFGMYILLRIRYNKLLSLTGSILFSSFSIFLLNFASGLIDIPGVSVSIWMMIFGILAIDKDPKYFYILFPLTVIGFFTRYTSIFTFPVILLYYLIKRNIISSIDEIIHEKNLFGNKLKKYLKSSEFRIIVSSMILSLLFAIIFCKLTLLDFGAHLTFFEQSANTLNVSNPNTNAVDYVGSKLYYLTNLFNQLSFGFIRDFDFILTKLFFIVMFGGLLIKIINLIKHLPESKNFPSNYKTKKLGPILIVILVISIIISFYEFKFLLNHLISNIFLIISLLIFFSLVSRYFSNKELQSLNLAMLAWFMIYLIFISSYPIKTYRYAIPFLPALVYFFIYGLESILCAINFGFNNKELKSKQFNAETYVKINLSKWTKLIPIFVILICIFSAFTYIGPWEIEENAVPSIEHINNKGYINDLVNITEYIKNNDNNYHSKTFGSKGHHERMLRYYLQENMTFVSDDKKLLDESDVDYLILNKKATLENYYEIYHCGDFYLYGKF